MRRQGVARLNDAMTLINFIQRIFIDGFFTFELSDKRTFISNELYKKISSINYYFFSFDECKRTRKA